MLLLIQSSHALANNKIAYINVEFLINNSNYGKEIIKSLKELNKKNLNNLSLKEKEIKQKDNKIANVKNVISKDELDLKIKNLKQEIKDFNILKDKLSNQLKKIEQDKIKFFFEKINPLIQVYMDQNSIDIIIDKKNIFIARSDYDITQKILELVNIKLINE